MRSKRRSAGRPTRPWTRRSTSSAPVPATRASRRGRRPGSSCSGAAAIGVWSRHKVATGATPPRRSPHLMATPASLLLPRERTAAVIGSLVSSLFVLLIVAVSAAVYLLPTLIGWSRHVPHAGSIAAINILLGWTLAGWAVAMAMALRSPTPGGAVVNVVQNLPPGQPWPAPSAPRQHHGPRAARPGGQPPPLTLPPHPPHPPHPQRPPHRPGE